MKDTINTVPVLIKKGGVQSAQQATYGGELG
jgi:hypothetical protein